MPVSLLFSWHAGSFFISWHAGRWQGQHRRLFNVPGSDEAVRALAGAVRIRGNLKAGISSPAPTGDDLTVSGVFKIRGQSFDNRIAGVIGKKAKK